MDEGDGMTENYSAQKEGWYWSCEGCPLSKMDKKKCHSHPGLCGEGSRITRDGEKVRE